MKDNEHYDLICAGTGFATTFFLKRFLEKSKENIRVLVLEKGANRNHQWYLNNHNTYMTYGGSKTFLTESPKDRWSFNIGFGGGSYAWLGMTPRFQENDFLMQTLFKQGQDWPIQYAELEPYYCQAESIMKVSGPLNSPYKKSQPYALVPHTMDTFNIKIQQKYPDLFYVPPLAKPTKSLLNRPKCCNSKVCSACPVDSKFTINNSMMEVYRDPRVEIRFEKHVKSLDIVSSKVKAVNYLDTEGEHKVYGNLFFLGTNPIFNSHILLQSGLKHPLLGTGICGQGTVMCEVDLDAFDKTGGSTNTTGIGYMLATDSMRKKHAGVLLESFTTIGKVRMEKGKYLQRARFSFQFEDLPQIKNYITTTNNPKIPKVVYKEHSSYTQKAVEKLKKNVQTLFSGLPVERFTLGELKRGGGHIYGGVVMGSDEENSIIDKNLRHHSIRNLIVAGSSSFPSTGLVNPTLTIAALSLHAADALFKGQK